MGQLFPGDLVATGNGVTEALSLQMTLPGTCRRARSYPQINDMTRRYSGALEATVNTQKDNCHSFNKY